MKGLLIKDLKVLSKQSRFILIIAIMLIFFIVNNLEASFIIAYTSIFFASFSLSALSYDDIDNSIPFLLTLPVSRKNYVSEKYIFCFLSTLTAFILSVIAVVIRDCIINNGYLNELSYIAASDFLVIIFFISLMIPLMIKLGAEKGRYAVFAVFGACFIIGFLLTKIVDFKNIMPFIDKFFSINDYIFIISIIIISIILSMISYIISINIMNNKEF